MFICKTCRAQRKKGGPRAPSSGDTAEVSALCLVASGRGGDSCKKGNAQVEHRHHGGRPVTASAAAVTAAAAVTLAPTAMHFPMPGAALVEPAAASASMAEAAGVRLVGTPALSDLNYSIAESVETLYEDCTAVRTVLCFPSS